MTARNGPRLTKALALGLLMAIVVLAAFGSNAFPQAPASPGKSAGGVFPASAPAESELADLVGQAKALAAEAETLKSRREAKEAEIALLVTRLQAMLPQLWTLTVRFKGMENAAGVSDVLGGTDRRKVWLDAVCDQTRSQIESLLSAKGEYATISAREIEVDALERLLATQIAAARSRLRPQSWPAGVKTGE